MRGASACARTAYVKDGGSNRATCSWKPILDNIESRFDSYLEQESRVNRQKVVDNRVHACLYFIQPTGHSCVNVLRLPSSTLTIDLSRLKQIDAEFMRRLHTKVNLIPVIAKADTLTDEEIISFKQRVCRSHYLRSHTNLCSDSLRYRTPPNPYFPSATIRKR